MRRRDKERPADSRVGRSPVEEVDAVLLSIGTKADQNKRRARAATIGLASSSALIPVFIGLAGDSFILGKMAPSSLAALSAILAAWVGVERPHERWSTYRGYERILQMEKLRYVHSIEPYAGADREALLIARLAQLQLELHKEWVGLLPRTPELLGKVAQ